MIEFLIILGALGAGALVTSVRILREYERGVVFRLGRLIERRGPGLIFLMPYGIDRMVKVPLRIKVLDVPTQEMITRDNVSVKVNAVVYFRVNEPTSSVMEIEDFIFGTSQLAQTTLRSVVGQSELDELLTQRSRINEIIRGIIDEHTDPWGIEVPSVEIKDIDLPQQMKRAMARQAEAERERRAKIIAAEGELQASHKLSEAASIMSRDPASIQLRYLQTVAEIATEKNSTTLFPIPIELFRPFLKTLADAPQAQAQPAPAQPAPSQAQPAPASLPSPPPSPGTKLDPARTQQTVERLATK